MSFTTVRLRSLAACLIALSPISILAGASPEGEECVDYSEFMHWRTGIETPGGAVGLAVSGDYAYVTDEKHIPDSGGLRVIDIADPGSPVLVGSVDTPGRPHSVVVSDGLAYVADSELGLQVFDVTDPTAPALIGSQDLDPPAGASALAISGHHAYVTGWPKMLRVFDVSDPTDPRLVFQQSQPGYASDVRVSGNHAYVSVWDYWWGQLQIRDITDPTAPTTVGTFSTPGPMDTVTVSGSMVYAGVDGPDGVRLIDVSDPASPVPRGWVDTDFNPFQIVLSERYAYAVNGGGFQVIDVADPDSPRLLGTHQPVSWGAFTSEIAVARGHLFCADRSWMTVLELRNGRVATPTGSVDFAYPANARGVDAAGRYAYVAAGLSGLQVVEAGSASEPVIVGSVELPVFAWHVAVSGEHAYVTGRRDGLAVVDVSDPRSPAFVDLVSLPGSATDVGVSGNLAFVTTKGEGLQVIDISDPTVPAILGSVLTPDRDLGVAVSGNRAYVGDRDGLHVIDVSDPTAPVVVGSAATDYSTRDVAVNGEHAYVVSRKGLEVIDVSDPTAPLLIRSVPTPGTSREVAIHGRFAYLTESEFGVRIFDLVEPSAPRLIGAVSFPGEAGGVAVAPPYFYAATWGGMEEEALHVAPVACEPPIQVTIEVGGPLNCKARNGVIPVAVLSTDGFEAGWIDHTTVTFGPDAASETHGNRHGVTRHEEYVNGDAALDLMFHFRLDETGIECGGDDRVRLEGRTYTGRKVEGGASWGPTRD